GRDRRGSHRGAVLTPVRRGRRERREGMNTSGPIACALAMVLAPWPGAGQRPAAPAPVRLTRDGGFKQHLQWSPDGRHFLLTRIHEGRMALWTMRADGSDLRPLLKAAPNTLSFDGHWSPDGKEVVFVHDTQQGTEGKLQINSVR